MRIGKIINNFRKGEGYCTYRKRIIKILFKLVFGKYADY